MRTIKENRLRLISFLLSTYLIIFGYIGESHAALSSTLADYYYVGLELSGYINSRGPVSTEMGQIWANTEEQFTAIQFIAKNTKSGNIPDVIVEVWDGSKWISYDKVGGKAQQYYDGAWTDDLNDLSAPYSGTTYRIVFNNSYTGIRFMGYWDSSSTYTGYIKANSITVSRSGLVASESKVQQGVDAANAAKTAANTAATNASNAYSAANTAATNANNAYNTLINGASNNGKSLSTTYDKANNAATQATNAANNTVYNSQSAAYWAYLAANNAETDTTPPTIKLTGLNGATCTTNSSFIVVVSASDNKSGQLSAQAKVGSGAWGSWTNVPGNLAVTLPTIGAHTITVQVKDAAGNISTANMTAFRL